MLHVSFHMVIIFTKFESDILTIHIPLPSNGILAADSLCDLVTLDFDHLAGICFTNFGWAFICVFVEDQVKTTGPSILDEEETAEEASFATANQAVPGEETTP